MAVTRPGTPSVATRSATGTDASVTHTVPAGTTLLVMTTMFEAGESVSGTPRWDASGGANLTLVDATFPSGSNNDMALETWAIVNPIAGSSQRKMLIMQQPIPQYSHLLVQQATAFMRRVVSKVVMAMESPSLLISLRFTM